MGIEGSPSQTNNTFPLIAREVLRFSVRSLDNNSGDRPLNIIAFKNLRQVLGPECDSGEENRVCAPEQGEVRAI
jgi:hypothetical protein